jgi:hypothetical protein
LRVTLRFRRSIEIGESQHRLGRGHGRTSREGVDTGKKLRGGEWLDEIIVASGFEPLDAIIDATEVGQKQHRCANTGGAQALDQRQAIESRQHAINDRYVVACGAGQAQALPTIGSKIDHMTALGQAIDDIGGRFGIIFDDQRSHKIQSSGACGKRGSRSNFNPSDWRVRGHFRGRGR